MFELSASSAIIGSIGILILLLTTASLMGIKAMDKLIIIQYGYPIGLFLVLVAGILQISNVFTEEE